jgi:peptidoglycan LD-endopeptidase CwlK
MPKFSKKSLDKLETCDERLKKIALKVVENFDCVVVYGNRSKEDQDKAFKEGKTKLKFPLSKHNSLPSKAMDLAPFINGEIVWDDRQCYYFAGYVIRVAEELGIKIRWGGDWNSNRTIKDQTFNDLVHFELVD